MFRKTLSCFVTTRCFDCYGQKTPFFFHEIFLQLRFTHEKIYHGKSAHEKSQISEICQAGGMYLAALWAALPYTSTYFAGIARGVGGGGSPQMKHRHHFCQGHFLSYSPKHSSNSSAIPSGASSSVRSASIFARYANCATVATAFFVGLADTPYTKAVAPR